ncbi:ATP-grasp domain-containing protein [Cellulomonas oligotrophica]|uniref:Biotin carboxylase n=1 Tax=Cellulomonas oligotrophica TaxID=931536 RepID=A0A7Y9JYZ9_9CELL|nr:ATP-grasp domain-containing protein [Cellulomonas oligotrophica]NYD87411.1 biotin carboxylase [Cellulomonas oligotrophica]GIG34111.1 hypothetical protein Col01nite_32700 [Cellulomonas oligotrophica]
MRIVALGTNRPCHHALVRSGHQVVLAIESVKRLADDDCAYTQVVEVPEADVVTGLPSAELVEALAAVGADRIAAYHDAYYELASNLADRLGTGCAVDVVVSRTLRDKAATRRATRDLACGRVRHVVLGPDEDLAAAAAVGLPCVVKPLDGEASIGVSIVTTTPELVSAVARARGADGAGRCLVEELVDGPEFSVETFSIAGRHEVLAVTEKFTIPGSPVEQGHLIPARVAPDVRAALARATRDVLDAVGLTDGPAHTELIASEDGPRLVESHDRLGGDRIALLVELATGVGYTELVARHGARLPIAPAEVVPTRDRAAAVWYSASAPATPATVGDVAGVDEARGLPGVERVEVLKPVGTSMRPIAGSFDRPALALATANDPDAAVATARDAADLVSFTYAPTTR